MEQLQLAITLPDGQTLNGEPRPEDERRLAEILAGGSTIQLTANDDDVQGHSFSDDVLVDVEGHAFALRLPTATDAQALRRALAVGAVTATLVGAGAIASLQPRVQAPTTGIQVPAAERVQAVPAQAVRAQNNEMSRNAGVEAANVPADADNPAIPAQALRAEQAEQAHDQALENADK
jgi:hypothetical protein